MSFFSGIKYERTKDIPAKQEVATEMINTQEEDYIIPLLNNYYANIVSTVKNYNIKDEDIYKNNVVKENLRAIDALLLERFGINFTHAYVEGVGYACLPVPPKHFNVLNREVKQNYKEVSKLLKDVEKNHYSMYSAADKADLLTEEDDDIRYIAIYKKFKNSFDKMEDVMNSKGVVIDRERAKVLGLPKDYIIILALDISAMIHDFDLNAKEFTAVLLHEIGHAFTHLEYSYKAISTTSVMSDVIVENMTRKNRSPKEAIKIAYEISTGEKFESDEYKSLNPIAATIYITEKFTRYVTGHNKHSATDSEQLADQFSNRFGQGVYLASALGKLTKNGSIDVEAGIVGKTKKFRNNYIASIYVNLLQLMLLLIIAIPLGFAFILVASIFIYVIVMVVIAIIYKIFFSGQSAVERETYDENRRRLERIRNDMVRQFRLCKFNKTTQESMISAIESVSELINNTPQETLPLLERLYIRFSTCGNKSLEIRTIERLSEDLMENSLYVASAKIKNLSK